MTDAPRFVKVSVEVVQDPDSLNWVHHGESKYAAVPFTQSMEVESQASDAALARALWAAIGAILEAK